MALIPDHGMSASAAASASGYAPSSLQSAYGLATAAALPGHGETVAIVDAYGDPQASSDLARYRGEYGLPACTVGTGCLKIVNQYGAKTGLPPQDPSGAWSLEESLDLDMVSAICPHCSIVLVQAATASLRNLAIAERTAIRSGAEAVSNSWGSGAEFTGETAYDSDFYAPGVAITAAAGDGGYGTQFPAAAPDVTSVGGTTLTGAPGSWTQTVWADSGSGCSDLQPKPAWQTADARYGVGCLNRTDNDVAADADPSTGVAIYDSAGGSAGADGWVSAGGTSVGSPIVAAAYALADIVAGGPHKALLPGTLPASYPYLHRSDFSDVSLGSDGSCEPDRHYLCQAVAGYDGPSGLGGITGTAGLTAPRPVPVTVLDPGTRVVQARAKVSFRIQALPRTIRLHYAARGLPRGLRLASDGQISGTAPASAGIRRVTVTVTSPGMAAGGATFDLVVLARLTIKRPGIGKVGLDGRCLTDPRDSQAAGTAVLLSRCTGKAGQNWAFVPAGGPTGAGELQIRRDCLTTVAGSAGRAKAIVEPCASRPRQEWDYLPSGHLRNVASGNCLAVTASGASAPAAVLSSCGGSAAMDWVLPAAPVLAGVAGQCLADPGGQTTPGTQVDLARCSASRSQRWLPGRGGTLTIAGRCLTVRDGSMLDGAAIVLAGCSDAASEQWTRGPSGELINQQSGRCLAAGAAESPADGAKLIQNDCYQLPGEVWLIS